jgi:ABC-2 type transport system ATP-binding protein
LMHGVDTTMPQVTVDEHTRRLTIATNGGAEVLLVLLRGLAAEHIEIDDIGLHRPTLDDAFLSLTGHSTEQDREAA